MRHRRKPLTHIPVIVLAFVAIAASAHALAQRQGPARSPNAGAPGLTQVLGRPADRSITLSVLSPVDLEAYVEFGTKAGEYTTKTDIAKAGAGVPLEIGITGLQPDTRYHYRLRDRRPGETTFREGQPGSFHTQRAPGATFAFALQGDSHPERLNRMYDPGLYRLTLSNVQKDQPDFYVMMGDDFSVDPLISRGQLSQQNVDQLYIDQRQFIGAIAASVPLFLVNGNHEQAARYKFVFAHHVLGTGRGAVEMADLYEWGGKDRNGESLFAKYRPGWVLPIHQLMVKTGVTIFFQGHDHLFARQEKDGLIYQEVPNPADNTYTAFNADAYDPATISLPGASYDPTYGVTMPNAGYLDVTVSPGIA
jgi:hypothetical protein